MPILSYYLQRGRCRRCGAPIDGRHVTVEVASAAIGLVAALAHPLALPPAPAFLGWWLLLIALLVLEYQWPPDRLPLPLISAGLAVAWRGLGPAQIGRASGRG